MDIIVDLNRDTDTVALTDAEAAGKYDLILYVVLGQGLLEQLNDLLRALQVAGGSDTNLNEYHILHLGQNGICEELCCALRCDGIEIIVDGDTNTLLALTHAEGAAEIDLVADVVLGDQSLKLFYHLAGAFDMAGATDTNCDFKHDMLPL